MSREFTKVGVVGLGTMGSGIVEVFARNGIPRSWPSRPTRRPSSGEGFLTRSTDRAVGRGKISQDDADALHARVTFTTDLADCADCQLVVEAVPEKLQLKKDILTSLDAIVAADAILATNTSSLPVTEIAVASGNPCASSACTSSTRARSPVR